MGVSCDIYSCVRNYEVLGKLANFTFRILQNTRLHSNMLLLTIRTFFPLLVLVLFPTSCSRLLTSYTEYCTL